MLLLHLKRILFFGLLGLIGATAWILWSKPIYEARLAIQVGRQQQQAPDPFMPPEVVGIIAQAESQQAATEVDILRQESLFAEAVQRVAQKQAANPESDYDKQLLEHYKRYYSMYSVTGGPVQADQNPMTISSLADITVRAYDPQTAIDLANTMGDVYTERRQDNLKRANLTAEGQLTDQK
ncbi:MAG TPA: hypothetical protein VKT78_13890, partial [Fimbriimonadaceae bacterium]|nr:hypothetical protein [Fimbriimonadaceae bacterium]